MPQVHTDIQAGSPKAIDQVIGQERAIRVLTTGLAAYFNDRAASTSNSHPPFPHVLLVGPPGVGKSMIAQIIGRELASTLHEELAQNILCPASLHALLMLPERDDVVFLDEIHELPHSAQTTLYRAIEEGRLFLPAYGGSERREVRLDPLTFVGATTELYALAKPLIDRFRIILHLHHYTDEQLAKVIKQRAIRLGWHADDVAIEGIAIRSRGTPRLAMRLLEATRRTARAQGESVITGDHLAETCDIEGIDAHGLNAVEQQYLRMLAESSGPVRLNVLASRLSLPRRTVERVIEDDLIRLGLVTKDDAGRVLTPQGRAHVEGSSINA